MTGPRIGSLFSGYGGLDLGVMDALGGSVAWHVEFDDAPSKILAHRFPDAPNYGDVTAVDWATVEPIDILTGGFPCQDVSLAGARAGLRDGTRSGLWIEFAKAIDELRPSLVVIENVRGLLSASAILTEQEQEQLEGTGDLESIERTLGEGDGIDRPVLRALGAVLGSLAELGYDARWCGIRAADAGAPHGRFRVFIIAHPAGEPWSVGNGDDVRARRGTVGREQAAGRGAAEDANLAVGGERRQSTSREGEAGRAWPDPGGRDRIPPSHTSGGRRDGRTQDPLRLALARVAAAGRSRGAGAPSDTDSGHERRRIADLVGSKARSREGVREERQRHGNSSTDRAASTRAWGPYAAAVAKWERVLGRPAPSPTEPTGKGGAHRLAPAFVEWMMGLKAGWLTDPTIGLTRAQQLKALGNGVVWQQASLAIRLLIAERAPAKHPWARSAA